MPLNNAKINAAFEFYCRVLQIDPCDIDNIEYYDPEMDPDLRGYCVQDADGSIDVYINADCGPAEALTTLAHELAHVRQILDGRLDLVGDGVYITWLGRRKRWTNSESAEWEREAYTMESILYSAWLVHCGKL